MQKNYEIKLPNKQPSGDDGALKIAIEQFAAYLRRADLAGEMWDDSYSEEVSFSSDRAHQDFLDEKAQMVKSTLLAKFREIVAPALDAEKTGEPGVLERDDPNDGKSYILREGADGVWVRIKNIDTHLYQTDEGVVADLYPAHEPEIMPVTSTYALFAECGTQA